MNNIIKIKVRQLRFEGTIAMDVMYGHRGCMHESSRRARRRRRRTDLKLANFTYHKLQPSVTIIYVCKRIFYITFF